MALPPLSGPRAQPENKTAASITATTGATSYILKRGTSSGNETTTVISGYTGTSYTNTALANGTTYYYLVAATDAGGTGPNSSEASATPSA